MTKVLFNMRSEMTKNFKCNFSSMYKEDLRCRLKCSNPQAVDKQSHLIYCEALKPQLSSEEVLDAQGVEYAQIYRTLEQQENVVLLLSRLLEIREGLLESLPVG